MNRSLVSVLLAIIVAIGFYLLYKVIYVYPDYVGKNPISVDNIGSQIFTINSETDTVLFGEKGTLITIKKNSFHDGEGNIVQGEVNVELKEIISQTDLIFSGLTTTSDGSLLETNGMIYLNVRQNNQQLSLDKKCKIGVIVPAKEINPEMKLFYGTKDNGIINWHNPAPLINNPDSVAYGTIPEDFIDIYGLERARQISDSLGIIGWSVPKDADSLMRYYDSVYRDYKSSEKFKSDSLVNSKRRINSVSDFYSSMDGINYIFEINKIGWLNIDRFIKQYETEAVEFSLYLRNSKFQQPQIRLVFLDLKTAIDGIQINNDQIVFGKPYVNSTVELPIKSKAMILATAYYKGKPYYDLKVIRIQKKQTINLNLKKATSEELKAEIQKHL